MQTPIWIALVWLDEEDEQRAPDFAAILTQGEDGEVKATVKTTPLATATCAHLDSDHEAA